MIPQETPEPEQAEITVQELLRISGLTMTEICALIDFGAIEPKGSEENSWVFAAQCIKIVRKAGRLKADFDLRPDGVALAVTYLERIEELELQIRRLRCYLPEENTELTP